MDSVLTIGIMCTAFGMFYAGYQRGRYVEALYWEQKFKRLEERMDQSG